MKHIAIIGGGIVGLTTAYFLRLQGFEVTVFDKDDFKHNCSTNNAGLLVPSHYIPLAAPGVIRQGIAWSLSPGSPFSLSYSKGMLRWAYHFTRSATRHHTETSYELLYELNRQSLLLFEKMASYLGFYFMHSGLTMYFKNRKSQDAELQHVKYAQKLGISYTLYAGTDIKKHEPEMVTDAYSALHYSSDASIDPEDFLIKIKTWLVDNGVVLRGMEEVKDINTAFGHISGICTKRGDCIADEYVIAGGISSVELFRKLGIYIPLQPGKGYSFDLPAALPVKHPAILVDGRVAISMLPGKTRISGTMQIGSGDNKINRNKINGIVKTVNNYFPENKIDTPRDEDVWVGHRPCSADGLPYVGRSSKFSNLLIATGHAMMGVSMSAITGKLLSELVSDNETSVALDKLYPERYNRL